MRRYPDHEAGIDASVEFGHDAGRAPQYRGIRTQSLYIPMRDGVRLAAELVLPGDLPPGARIPALLRQTRYWRAMELRPPFNWLARLLIRNPRANSFTHLFTGHGYALVAVDVRGSGASFGNCPYPWDPTSVEDAREIVEWIVAQPWSDGKVGGLGTSYVGTTAELLCALNHPAVKATLPQFNHPDPFTDIAFPGGIFNTRFVKAWGHFDHLLDQNTVPPEFGFFARMAARGVKPADGDLGRQWLQSAVRDHAANGDIYALADLATYRDQRHERADMCIDDLAVHRFNGTIARSGVAVCGWASWMDAGTADAALRRFLTFDNVRRTVIGAWDHGGYAHASPYVPPDTPVSPDLPTQRQEMLRFFDAYLKDIDNGVHSEKVLFYYTLGEEKWKKTHVWPPEGATMARWYLAENAALSPQKPAVESGADTYAVDFEATTGDTNRWWEMGIAFKQTVVYPNRAEAGRHLLTYTSPPLAEDTEITGHPIITLYVTSTETDGALYVYLEDVDESGHVTYVTEGQLRVIHRKVSSVPPYKLLAPYHSFRQTDALPLVPGEVAEITFGLLPTSVLIRRSHRIRVGIAGHDDGTFVRIPAEGTPVLTVARNRVYASCIDLPIVKKR